jgi:hypothetical protein
MGCLRTGGHPNWAPDYERKHREAREADACDEKAHQIPQSVDRAEKTNENLPVGN